MPPLRLIWIATILNALLTTCTQESVEQQRAHALMQAANAAPVDEHLAALYKQSCKTCHATENSGAPLVRDHSQWDSRWNKGLPTLMQSVIAGLNGMPAGGQCFACTAADYELLIKFLAGRE